MNEPKIFDELTAEEIGELVRAELDGKTIMIRDERHGDFVKDPPSSAGVWHLLLRYYIKEEPPTLEEKLAEFRKTFVRTVPGKTGFADFLDGYDKAVSIMKGETP